MLECFENILSHLSVKNKVWDCQNLFVVDFSSKKEHFLLYFGFQPVQLPNVDCPLYVGHELLQNLTKYTRKSLRKKTCSLVQISTKSDPAQI